MAGLGFGSLAGGRFADRLSPRRALEAFAVCEALIGAIALLSPWLYYDFAYLRLGALSRYPLALPFEHLLLLLPPTLLMGASLPLLARGVTVETAGAARSVALLYGMNTLGAGAGALATVWYLAGTFGFAGSLRLGALLNLAASAGSLWLASSAPASPAEAAARVPAVVAPGASLARWALVYGLCGLLALSYEILCFRMLDVMIKSSPYTFGHLLGLFLCFVGLGSLVGAALAPRSARPERAFFWSQWGASASAGVALAILCHAPHNAGILRSLHRYWGLPEGLDSAPGLASQAFSIYLLVPLSMLAPPAILMGASFAYVQRLVQTRFGEVGWRVGVVQASNIVGCMLGSLLTGTLALSFLGTARSFALLVLTGTVFAWLAQDGTPRGRAACFAAAAASIVLALSVPSPDAFWSRFHGRAAAEIVTAEDATGVAAIPLPGRWTTMRVNGRGHSHIPYGGIHTLLGAIPALLRYDLEDVFILGMGSGNTAWAAGCAPGVKRIEVYEIVRPELAVLRELLRRVPERRFPSLRGFLADPRIRLAFTDGRLALRNSALSFDLIEADGLDPTMAYSGNLYSREFFELARRRLKPRGIFCSYVPTQRTARTIASVFPHGLDLKYAGHPRFILASNAPIAFDLEAVRARLHSPWTQAYFDRAGLNPRATEQIEDFLARAQVSVLRRPSGSDADDLNTDLFPRDEFSRPPIASW
jgi:spermidine synthase